jgi:NIPSNAP
MDAGAVICAGQSYNVERRASSAPSDTVAPLKPAFRLSGIISSAFAKMPAVTRRLLLESFSSLPMLSAALLAASQRADARQSASTVYELRVYHAAPGKLGELLARFREHTMKLFEKHGMKNLAYWTPVDEPEKGNMLVYILQHPSRDAATANWKSFQDDPEWKRVKAESEANGKLAEKIDSTFMALTDFSPRLR